MTDEELLRFAEQLSVERGGKDLEPIEKKVILFTLEEKKFREMSIPPYKPGYIKTVLAPKLWTKLSPIVLGKEKGVTKHNLRTVLESALKDYENSGLRGHTLFNRYQIKQLLDSEEEFTKIYLAKDLHLNKHCIVKELLFQSNEKIIEKFEREVGILYKLGRHPQIQSLSDHKKKKERLYLFYEHIEGEVLSKDLSEDECSPSLNEQKVFNLLQDILNILNFIHKQEILHRDIRPSNLIQTSQGVVLTNFSCLKKLGSEEELTFNTSIGKCGYMAPEQASGLSRFSSDIYSLGILCVQALTGKPPKQFKINRDTGEFVWQNQTNISPAFGSIIVRMIRRDFKERYNSVEEVLQDLKTIKNT